MTVFSVMSNSCTTEAHPLISATSCNLESPGLSAHRRLNWLRYPSIYFDTFRNASCKSLFEMHLFNKSVTVLQKQLCSTLVFYVKNRLPFTDATKNIYVSLRLGYADFLMNVAALLPFHHHHSQGWSIISTTSDCKYTVHSSFLFSEVWKTMILSTLCFPG